MKVSKHDSEGEQAKEILELNKKQTSTAEAHRAIEAGYYSLVVDALAMYASKSNPHLWARIIRTLLGTFEHRKEAGEVVSGVEEKFRKDLRELEKMMERQKRG